MAGEIPQDIRGEVDEAAIRRARAVATLLDESVEIPGTNFKVGVDPVLGALPVSGDVVVGAMSMYIVYEATRLGVPYTTIVRMLANVGVDVAVGSVPVVGTLFDAVWKANKWNVDLLERELEAMHGRSEGREITIEVEDEGEDGAGERDGVEELAEEEDIDAGEEAERIEEIEASEGMDETETAAELEELEESAESDDSNGSPESGESGESDESDASST
ncbi:DUF4112 domain-containing protein [Halegenticoccus soli]|uniref:DUF4112 domain-containing protein n=1 Tax=Halegenticoccus soli TaxID=1985678 RepID=UPI001E504EE2|nr:DUF4112 domain-containing protein [Halegenticoccus soli]